LSRLAAPASMLTRRSSSALLHVTFENGVIAVIEAVADPIRLRSADSAVPDP
jgi:hypothetical protein